MFNDDGRAFVFFILGATAASALIIWYGGQCP